MSSVSDSTPVPKVVLVTGASSGIGNAIASLLSSRGYKVFGSSRRPRTPSSFPFEMLELDVNSDKSVDDCVKKVVDSAGRLDILVEQRRLVDLRRHRGGLHRAGEVSVRDELIRCHEVD